MKYKKKKIYINKIIVKERIRGVQESFVKQLMRSIKVTGKYNPILINAKNELVDGLQRLIALKRLGYTSILVYEIEYNEESGVVWDKYFKILEILINLSNPKLRVLERAKYYYEQKMIYLELYPQTKSGISQSNAMNCKLGSI